MKIKPSILLWVTALAVILLFVALFGLTFGIVFIAGNLVTVFLLYYFSKKNSGKWRFIYRGVCSLYALFLLSFAAVELLIIKEAGNVPEEAGAYAVILGAGLKGKEISQTLKTRLETGAGYLKEHNDVTVIVSGGQGEGEDIPESTAMAEYLLSKGISENRIIEEDESTTTWENLENSKEILKSKGAESEKIILITSDYHMYRAQLTCENLDIKCSGLAGESGFFIKINYMIREYFAVVKTMLF